MIQQCDLQGKLQLPIDGASDTAPSRSVRRHFAGLRGVTSFETAATAAEVRRCRITPRNIEYTCLKVFWNEFDEFGLNAGDAIHRALFDDHLTAGESS